MGKIALSAKLFGCDAKMLMERPGKGLVRTISGIECHRQNVRCSLRQEPCSLAQTPSSDVSG